jgi:hypothetical protein
MDVLFGLVRVMPRHFLLESPALLVVLGPANIRPDDPFQGMKHRPGTKTVKGIRPVGSRAEIDGIVITVGKTETKKYSSRRFSPESIDELLAHEAHGGGAQNDHALLVQPDDSLVGTKI